MQVVRNTGRFISELYFFSMDPNISIYYKNFKENMYHVYRVCLSV